jgi:hypothetical protein
MANAQAPAPAPLVALPNFPSRWDRNSMQRLGITFDSLRIKAGAALAAGDYELFTIQKGGQATVVNDSTLSFLKDAADTNLTQPGQLSGEVQVVQAVSVEILLTGAQATYAASGQNVTRITDPAPIATGVHDATNLLKALTEYCSLRFQVNEEDVFDPILLGDLPDPFGVSGAAGAGSANTFNSAWQNGYAGANMLPQAFTLTPEDQFKAIIKNHAGFTITQPFALKVKLHGPKMRSISIFSAAR